MIKVRFRVFRGFSRTDKKYQIDILEKIVDIGLPNNFAEDMFHVSLLSFAKITSIKIKIAKNREKREFYASVYSGSDERYQFHVFEEVVWEVSYFIS